uniref:Saposin B-type domain-containing protein n=1 Tax=Plectus sambesii TaxID=2011161 RepID=A0A914WZN4_9BILA
MYRLIVLTALLVPLCLAGTDPHKEAMIKDNKTPKNAPALITTACDECKTLVDRFNEAVKDPSKVAELKNLLSLMCDTTSYSRECKLIVSRLDVIIRELGPYMRDSTAVCKKIHMCGNARLQKIHRLGLIYAKKYLNNIEGLQDVVCEECQFAVAELKSLVEERSSQAELKQFIHDYFCKHLGQYQGTCDLLVEEFLPQLFQELEQILQNSKQVCADLGLCPGHMVRVNGQSLHPADNSANRPQVARTYRIKTFTRMLNNLQTKNGIHMSCFECDAAFGLVLAGIKTESANVATGLREMVCGDILPAAYADGCTDFLTLYLPTVVDMTAGQVTPNTICEKFHMCDQTKSNAVRRLPASQKAAVACESRK